MDMMEKYARNMEENVEERAQQLLEEKRKTDRLLYRLLPAWVSLDITFCDLSQLEEYAQDRQFAERPFFAWIQSIMKLLKVRWKCVHLLYLNMQR